MINTLAGQFVGQGFHFGVSLFASLACLAAGWLYLDAWSVGKHTGEFFKGVGFLLLTTAFVITGATWGDPGWLDVISGIMKFLGYSGIALGHFIEPLNPKPKISGYTPDEPAPATPAPTTQPTLQTTPTTPAAPTTPDKPIAATPTAPAVALSLGHVSLGLSFLIPVAALSASLMYWRLATTGLERHLKPLALAFSIFTLAETLALTAFWQHNANPILQTLSAPLGLFWILQHLTLMIATILLAALLLSSLQHDALASLQTATKVLSYAIDTKTADTRTSAEVLAQNPAVVAAAINKDHAALTTLASELMIRKHLSDALITDETGVVLARASDPERSGDSLSDNSLVQHALLGDTSSSLAKRTSAVVPTIVTSTASPITSGGQIIGLAITSLALDNAFVDGLKHTTGLDSTVYTDTTRAATTITASDQVSRPIGTKETHSQVITTTIKQGQIWQGPLDVAGQPYLAVFLPLKDITNSTIGMLFVGQPQSAVLHTAQAAIRLTFACAALSLIVIMAVVFVIARQIVRQLH